MKKWLRKGVLTGIGIGLMTKERVEEAARKLAEDAKMSEKETKSFIKELKENAEKSYGEIEKKIDHRVNETVSKMGLVSREEFEKLLENVDTLRKSVEKQGKTGSGEKKSASDAKSGGKAEKPGEKAT